MVDDFLPWTKGLSRASGGVNEVGNTLDYIDTGAHVIVDVVDNIEKRTSWQEYAGDIAGEGVILGANPLVDTAASSLGMLGGGAVGSAIGSISPDPITTVGGGIVGASVGKVVLPAVAGFTMGHFIDKTYNNGLTGRENIKTYITHRLEGK